jgi:hypothetical protein
LCFVWCFVGYACCDEEVIRLCVFVRPSAANKTWSKLAGAVLEPIKCLQITLSDSNLFVLEHLSSAGTPVKAQSLCANSLAGIHLCFVVDASLAGTVDPHGSARVQYTG